MACGLLQEIIEGGEYIWGLVVSGKRCLGLAKIEGYFWVKLFVQERYLGLVISQTRRHCTNFQHESMSNGTAK